MQSDSAYADQVRMDPADFNPKKDIKGKAIGKETEAFESWVDETVNEYAKPIDLTNKGMFKTADEEDRQAKLKALQDLQMDPKTSKDPEMQAEIQKRKRELEMQKEENQLEGLTFEDIKPYVSMYTDKDGKKVNAVLDKDGEEVFKTHDAKAAMAYLAQNYDKLKKEDNAPDMVIRDPDDEAEDKEQEIAKDQEEAEKINTELDRIKQLANI